LLVDEGEGNEAGQSPHAQWSSKSYTVWWEIDVMGLWGGLGYVPCGPCLFELAAVFR